MKVLTELTPLVGKIEIYFAKKKLTQKQVEALFKDHSLEKISILQKQMQKLLESCKLEVKSVDETVKNYEKLLKTIEDTLIDIKKQREKWELQQKRIERQKQIFEEFANKDPKDLIALLSSMELERKKLEKDVKQYYTPLLPEGNIIKKLTILKKIFPIQKCLI